MRETSKYFIDQVIINEGFNPTMWTEDNFKEVTKDNLLIGYLFSVKEGVSFGLVTQVLNLYLIKPSYYRSSIEEIVTLSDLQKAYEIFIDKMLIAKKTSDMMVFKNPPILEWLDTKENWCKKQADEIVKRYNWDFGEALSQVYYIITKCFRKKRVYMGNLQYIKQAINTSILMDYRYNRNRLNGNHPLVISGDQQVCEDSEDSDDKFCTVFDTIGQWDEYYAQEDYKQFEADVRAIMRQDFSDREIDQILTQKAGFLPMGLYRRLARWRKKHSIEEFRKLI